MNLLAGFMGKLGARFFVERLADVDRHRTTNVLFVVRADLNREVASNMLHAVGANLERHVAADLLLAVRSDF